MNRLYIKESIEISSISEKAEIINAVVEGKTKKFSVYLVDEIIL